MNNNKLSIRFLIYKSRINKTGTCPIRCRITCQHKRKEFSTGQFTFPRSWDSKKQLVKPPDKNADFINTQLSLISRKINEAFLYAQVNYDGFTIDDIMILYKGDNIEEQKTVITVFTEHNEKVEKLVGKEYVLPTLWKYRQAKVLLQDFIKFKYRRSDFQFKDLTVGFLKEYEFYLKTEKNLAQSSTYKAIQRFKKIIKIAISEGYLDRDPFLMYKVKRPKSQVIYLTVEQLKNT